MTSHCVINSNDVTLNPKFQNINIFTVSQIGNIYITSNVYKGRGFEKIKIIIKLLCVVKILSTFVQTPRQPTPNSKHQSPNFSSLLPSHIVATTLLP